MNSKHLKNGARIIKFLTLVMLSSSLIACAAKSKLVSNELKSSGNVDAVVSDEKKSSGNVDVVVAKKPTVTIKNKTEKKQVFKLFDADNVKVDEFEVSANKDNIYSDLNFEKTYVVSNLEMSNATDYSELNLSFTTKSKEEVSADNYAGQIVYGIEFKEISELYVKYDETYSDIDSLYEKDRNVIALVNTAFDNKFTGEETQVPAFYEEANELSIYVLMTSLEDSAKIEDSAKEAKLNTIFNAYNLLADADKNIISEMLGIAGNQIIQNEGATLSPIPLDKYSFFNQVYSNSIVHFGFYAVDYSEMSLIMMLNNEQYGWFVNARDSNSEESYTKLKAQINARTPKAN